MGPIYSNNIRVRHEADIESPFDYGVFFYLDDGFNLSNLQRYCYTGTA